MKPEMFVLEPSADKRSEIYGGFHKKITDLITEVKKELDKKHLSPRELYELMIHKNMLKPAYYREFEKIIRWGLREGFIDKNKLVSRLVKGTILPNVFTKEQLIRLFGYIKDPQTIVACLIAVKCGLRIGEVTRIKISDIDFDTETIRIVQSKRAKDRDAPFLIENHELIKKWIKYSGAKEYLFPSYQSHSLATINTPHISTRTITNSFNKSLREANLYEVDDRYKKQGSPRKKFTFHAFRHTFATYHLEKGVSPAIVKKALGHSRMDTTVNIYGHIKDNVMIQALRGKRALVSKKEKIKSEQVTSLTETPKITQIQENPLKILAQKFALGKINKREFITRTEALKTAGIY